VSQSQDKQEALDFARKMVKRLRDQMLEQGGATSVSTDNISVDMGTGSDSIREQLKYWENQVIVLSSSQGMNVSTIDVSKGLG
jgi:hypothetical protein